MYVKNYTLLYKGTSAQVRALSKMEALAHPSSGMRQHLIRKILSNTNNLKNKTKIGPSINILMESPDFEEKKILTDLNLRFLKNIKSYL